MEELSNRVRVDYLQINLNLLQILVYLIKINLQLDLISQLKAQLELYLISSSNQLNQQLEVDKDYLDKIKIKQQVYLTSQN